MIQIEADRIAVKCTPYEVYDQLYSLFESRLVSDAKMSYVHSSLEQALSIEVDTGDAESIVDTHRTIIRPICNHPQIVPVRPSFHFIYSFLFISEGLTDVPRDVLNELFKMLSKLRQCHIKTGKMERAGCPAWSHWLRILIRWQQKTWDLSLYFQLLLNFGRGCRCHLHTWQSLLFQILWILGRHDWFLPIFCVGSRIMGFEFALAGWTRRKGQRIACLLILGCLWNFSGRRVLPFLRLNLWRTCLLSLHGSPHLLVLSRSRRSYLFSGGRIVLSCGRLLI